MHYVDEGDGPTLLMLHGNPTWSFLYRDMIAALRSQFRCVALDYPGFGLSSAAAGYGFTAAEHADVVEAFVAHLDLTDVTPVVQDWGRADRHRGRRASPRALPGAGGQHLGVAQVGRSRRDPVQPCARRPDRSLPHRAHQRVRRTDRAVRACPPNVDRARDAALHSAVPDAETRVPTHVFPAEITAAVPLLREANAASRDYGTSRRSSCGAPRTARSVRLTDAGGSMCSATTTPTCCVARATTSRTTPAMRHRGRSSTGGSASARCGRRSSGDADAA